MNEKNEQEAEIIDISQFREQTLKKMQHSVDEAFKNRRQVDGRSEAVRHINNSIRLIEQATGDELDLGTFNPELHMVVTRHSHDYPLLLYLAWMKILNEAGLTIEKNQTLAEEVWKSISRDLSEEYHHAIPLNDEKQRVHGYGVYFTENAGNEYGFVPFIALQGKIKLFDYYDAITAPKNRSESDNLIAEYIQNKK